MNQILKLLAYTGFFISILFSNQALAIGNVYLQNNTSLQLTLATNQYGHAQLDKGDEWNQTQSTLKPWQKNQKVLWYNRNQGITWGKNFYFDTEISVSGQAVATLRQRLKGTMTFSNLYHGLAGDDFNHTWFQGYDIEGHTFHVDGRTYTIKYSADYNAGTASDDLVYAIHEVGPYTLPQATSDKTLKVLTYNLYTIMTRTAADINRRMGAIVDVLSGYDVIVFEEAFYNPARSDLINNISTEYPYVTDVVDTSGYAEDGGVFIASKWPITFEAQKKYDACSGVDCLSPKGVMYARIQKNTETYHVFGSHLQAEDSSSAKSARMNQLHELKSFVTSFSIPTREAVIIAGDLNVDKLGSPTEYTDMLAALQSEEPLLTSYSHQTTYESSTNSMAGGTAWLDYVLVSLDHKQPTSAEQAALVLKSSRDSMFQTWDYSDHYAVMGFFEFD